MTKIQNKWTNKKIIFLVFLFLTTNAQIFGQNIIFNHEISMLALGDSYTIGESVELNERWPHQLVAKLGNRGAEVRDPDSADFNQIKKIFYQQEVDWNKGDIDAFMKAYWNSEELQFGGANGITKGWQETLKRYKSGYPDRASMGQLSFQIKDMTRHSESVVSLTGSWQLTRLNDQPGGHFLLIWRKINGEWKIVVDHTSQKLPE